MQEKIKKPSNFLTRLKKIHFTFGTDGDMDWVTVFCFSIFLFILISCWGIYMYIFARVKGGPEIQNSVTSELIDEEKFQTILLRYQEKKSKFEEISSTKPVLVDPAR